MFVRLTPEIHSNKQKAISIGAHFLYKLAVSVYVTSLELTQQKLEIGNLKQKLAELETYSKRRDFTQKHLANVAAVDSYDPRRSSSLDRHSRRDSKVHFTRRSSLENRDSSFSRQQGRGNSYSRSRDPSPAHYRENRFHSNNRYQNNNRNRPVQRYRSQNDLNNRNNYQNQNNGRNNSNRSRQNNSQDQANSQRQSSLTQKDITFYNCGKRGHIAREYWADMARDNQPYNHNN